MKRRIELALAILMMVMLLFGCSKEETAEETVLPSIPIGTDRPGYQKDKHLIIALESELGEQYNPFVESTPGEELVLSVIFSSPLRPNIEGELIPWYGNILSSENADGSTSYIVSISDEMHFTDGTPMTIDDYLYTLYVLSDPSYQGPDALHDMDIRGMKEYYYDDLNWKENLERIREKVLEEAGDLDDIDQDFFTSYLERSRLEGRFDDRTTAEWNDILRENGWFLEAENATTEEELLSAVALYEYAEHGEDYDPVSWYLEEYEKKYIRWSLTDADRTEPVDRISGIEKLGERSARITLDDNTHDARAKLNVKIVPAHFYGEFEKGDVTPVTRKNMPLGSGPYTLYAVYDERVVLKAEDSYNAGIPNIGYIIFENSSEETILASLENNTVDIGLLSGKPGYLDRLRDAGMRFDLLIQGRYPSIFFNADTLSAAERKNLYSIVETTVKYLPITQLEQKVQLPLSPLIPENPGTRRVEAARTDREPIAGGREIRLLVSDVIPEKNMARLSRNLHNDIVRNGNTLSITYMREDRIAEEMRKGNADMCILPSLGTLDEKASMYHSEGSSNIQNISDPLMDEILEKLLTEPTLDERRKLAGMLMDRIISEALEIPLYQNRAIIAYDPNTLDMESIPEVSTFSWNFLSSLWRLRKN